MTTMQQRRGTAAQWTAKNTVLAQGEIGLETDTGKFKFGDGTTAWTSLTYAPAGGPKGFAKARRTSGDLSLPGSTTYADALAGGGLDLTVPAAPGDLLEASLGFRASAASGVWVVLDFHTVVAGAAVNSFAADGAVSTAASFSPWCPPSPALSATGGTPVGASKIYTAVAGDISGGNVTVRLRYRSGGSFTIAASSADPVMYVELVNLGQPSPGAAGNGAWQTPTFQNGWVNYGAPYAPAQYMKDALGFVHLRGLIKSGTMSTAAFTLPAGFRPAYSYSYAVPGSSANSGIGLDSTGAVTPATGTNGYIYLDGITFLAEQ